MDKRILSEIWIYPVKALGGIRLSAAQVMEKGLANDRRWMLVDEQNRFLTQREYHSLALFKTSNAGDTVRINYKSDSIDLPLGKSLNGEMMDAKVWDDVVKVVETPSQYGQWFSDRLNSRVKLVWFPEESERRVDQRYAQQGENVSLADAYPLMIIGKASLQDLNYRLEQTVPMNRFRPNLVFEGGVAYEEDEWKEFSIGGNRFVGVKNCARCITITIDQETGERGREPLLTLSRYRREGEKIKFGQNVLAVDHKIIKEGDEITLG